MGLFLFIIAAMFLLGVGALYYGYIRLRGMTITSWWRSYQKNIDVGGAGNSLHMIGLAWDVVPVTDENAEILRSAGLKVINEGDHLHAQII
jgi:uncharacterized protein YcbK (DUF882 family)